MCCFAIGWLVCPLKSRETLLIVALSALPTIDLVEAMGRSDSHLPVAEQAGIVVTSGRAVTFAHPLLTSAVHADAAPSSRREVHRQLASHTTDWRSELDISHWHSKVRAQT